MPPIAVTLRNTSTAIQGLDYIRAYDYGLRPTATPAVNRAAAQQALTDSIASRKTVRFPAGVFDIDAPLNFDLRAKVAGEGRDSTTFRATVAMGSMLSYTQDNLVQPESKGISGLGFDCNSLAQTGLEIHSSAFFLHEDIFVTRHLGYGVEVKGSLIGSFTDLMIREGMHGIRFQERPNVVVPGTLIGQGVVTMPPNLMQLYRPNLSVLKGQALNYSRGAGLYVYDMDLEQCGSELDINTAVIHVFDTCPLGEGIGFVISGGWAEVHWGGSLIHIGASLGRSRHAIRDFQFNGSAGNSQQFVTIEGGTHANILTLDNVQEANLRAGGVNNGTSITPFPAGAGKGVVVVGSAKVYQQPNCNITDGYTTPTPGQYVIVGEGLGSGSAPSNEPAATAKFKDQVLYDVPFYYNRLIADPNGVCVPTVGTANVQAYGGASMAGISATPNDSTSNSLNLGGAGQGASVALDLTAYQNVIVEFWYYMDELHPGGANLLCFGENWAVVGGFVYAPKIIDGTNAINPFSYAGYFGNLSDASTAAPFALALVVGWNHVVLDYKHTELYRYLVNGQAVAFTSDKPANTSFFGNKILYIGGQTGQTANPFAVGKIQDLAIYTQNLPSTARFAAHYAARNN